MNKELNELESLNKRVILLFSALVILWFALPTIIILVFFRPYRLTDFGLVYFTLAIVSVIPIFYRWSKRFGAGLLLFLIYLFICLDVWIILNHFSLGPPVHFIT